MSAVAFYVFAVVAIFCSLLVVGQRNPMYSVLLLIGSFGALAGLYVLLDAPFVAAIQIIIYAGAIMVLFLFVVMLLNVPREEAPPAGRFAAIGPGPRRFGAVLAALLAIELVWALRALQLTPFPSGGGATTSSVQLIGVTLFRDYAFAFEATSVLILLAMVGSVILARRETPQTAEAETKAELESVLGADVERDLARKES